MSSARCAVWIGGSNVTSWSLIGSWSRCCSISALDVVALERRPGSRGTARSASCTTRTCRCRCRPRSLRRTPSPSSRRGGVRAAPGTARAASRSTGTDRRRARRRGRSRSRRSRLTAAIDSRRCTGRSNRIRSWTSRSPSRNATWSGSAATSRRRRSRRARRRRGRRRVCPTDLLREMGALGPARHADPRGVGRHRHVDGRLRRRDGADRPGRPVGGRRVAGARDDRFAAAVPVRQRRAARALAAAAGRGTRARRVRSDRARRRLRRARHPHARPSGATAAG